MCTRTSHCSSSPQRSHSPRPIQHVGHNCRVYEGQSETSHGDSPGDPSRCRYRRSTQLRLKGLQHHDNWCYVLLNNSSSTPIPTRLINRVLSITRRGRTLGSFGFRVSSMGPTLHDRGYYQVSDVFDGTLGNTRFHASLFKSKLAIPLQIGSMSDTPSARA